MLCDHCNGFYLFMSSSIGEYDILKHNTFKAFNNMSIEKIANKSSMLLHNFTKTSYNQQKPKIYMKYKREIVYNITLVHEDAQCN